MQDWRALLSKGVTLEDEVFLRPGVKFIHDRFPRATVNGRLQGAKLWQPVMAHERLAFPPDPLALSRVLQVMAALGQA